MRAVGCIAGDHAALQNGTGVKGASEQPDQASRAEPDHASNRDPDQATRAEPSGPSTVLPSEVVNVDTATQSLSKSNAKLEKKSSRDSKRDEADRRASRAKRRRSKSRDQSRSPKRYTPCQRLLFHIAQILLLLLIALVSRVV